MRAPLHKTSMFPIHSCHKNSHPPCADTIVLIKLICCSFLAGDIIHPEQNKSLNTFVSCLALWQWGKLFTQQGLRSDLFHLTSSAGANCAPSATTHGCSWVGHPGSSLGEVHATYCTHDVMGSNLVSDLSRMSYPHSLASFLSLHCVLFNKPEMPVSLVKTCNAGQLFDIVAQSLYVNCPAVTVSCVSVILWNMCVVDTLILLNMCVVECLCTIVTKTNSSTSSVFHE